MPGTGVLSAYCHTVQVDQGLVALGTANCGFGLARCHSAIHGIHCVTVLSNQVLANDLEA